VNGDSKLRVVVVDDSEVVRLKLSQLFATAGVADGIELVGEAPDGEAGVDVIRQQKPDVVVMDLKMPGLSGIEATWQLGTVAPASQVLMLTVSDDPADAADAIMAGAKGYIIKGAPDEEIVGAIRKVAAGERAISPQVAAELVERSNQAISTRPAASPARAVRGVPATSALGTVFTLRNLVQTVVIGILIGVLLTGINQGEEIVNGDTGSDLWIQAVLNAFVGFVAVNIGLLAGKLSARR